jgi:2-polyprenyl-6-methoxyphenol hydroxylase-like FAD-dependent oxidoreductase
MFSTIATTFGAAQRGRISALDPQTGDALAMTDTIKLPAELDLLDVCDVCVVGGGLAGVAAALAVSAGGLDTVLVEERGALAWEISHGLELFFDSRTLPVTLARIVTGLESQNAVRAGMLDPVAVECLMDRMVAEVDVRVHFRAFAAEYDAEGKRVRLTTKSGPLAIQARAVIDATENSRLARNSGARFNGPANNNGLQSRSFLLCGVTAPSAVEKIQIGQNEVTVRPTLWPHEAHVSVNCAAASPEQSESQARMAIARVIEALRRSKSGFENASLSLSAHEGFALQTPKLDAASLAEGLFAAGPALLGRKPTLAERAQLGEQTAAGVIEALRSVIAR